MAAATDGSMRETDWRSLVSSVEGGKCTLMLGPDAVTGVLDGVQLPIHHALATFVKDRLGPEFASLDPSKPSSVAQAATNAEDPYVLQGWVEEFYEEFESDYDVLRDLAALPFELVVNSSPGLSVYDVFHDVKPGTHGDYYDRTAPARAALPDPSRTAPVVYNLFGSLEEPESLILTERDRLDFLVAVVTGEPPLPPKLQSYLRDPKRTMLFLGFALDQWQFRLLLHVLAKGDRKYKSFAFELPDAAPDSETRDFYRIDHKIHFFSGDPAAFTAELRGRVHEEDSAAPAESDDDAGPPPDAPLVFLCHASEDKEFAERLSDDLQRAGMATWLDKAELVGGEQWAETIPKTITERVNYLVVLQSSSLQSKVDAYVNREIGLALDRQKNVREPCRFLIPAIIDDPGNRLDILERFQSVDLSGANGVQELVRTINLDLAYRDRLRR